MLTLAFNASREITYFLSLCCSYQANISICEKYLFTLVFTCLFSWYFKIVGPQVCFSLLSTRKLSQKCRVKFDVIVATKRELSQAKSQTNFGWLFILFSDIYVLPHSLRASLELYMYFQNLGLALFSCCSSITL